ncbi:GNAT family N-acetyltransferase [Microbispora corallina]|uniref:GNAT family N-acetyltransferase n=1 Tax=Microbispora corallina TaxID=83302 RepID=UPI0035572B59
MIVREARPDEMDQVGRLRVAAYEAEDLLAANPAYAETLRLLGTRGDGEVLVAVEDGRAVGTAMLQLWGPGCEVAREAGEAEMRALAVDPAARGRGVGGALVEAVAGLAASRGARRLVLSTQPRMTSAQRLYLAKGFDRLPERDWTPVPGLTLLAFGKAVTAGR